MIEHISRDGTNELTDFVKIYNQQRRDGHIDAPGVLMYFRVKRLSDYDGLFTARNSERIEGIATYAILKPDNTDNLFADMREFFDEDLVTEEGKQVCDDDFSSHPIFEKYTGKRPWLVINRQEEYTAGTLKEILDEAKNMEDIEGILVDSAPSVAPETYIDCMFRKIKGLFVGYGDNPLYFWKNA